MKATVKIFLLILCLFGFVSVCKKKDDIVIYRVVSPPKPLFDAEKYNLVDTSKSFTKLRTQAYTTDDVHERIQIFDYLLTYHPREADVGEFFKHYYPSEKIDWHGTRQLELITNTISQNRYAAIKERCLYYSTWYYIANTQVDSIIMWMDSLHSLYPKSKLFLKHRYSLLLEVSQEIDNTTKNKTLIEPERIWRLGNAYWRLATSEFKSPFFPFKKKAHAFFDTLQEEYPKSPFNANVRYVIISDVPREIHDDHMLDHELQLASQLEQIIKEYPSADVRHEVMLRMACSYLFVGYMTKETQPDTAYFYFRRGDSLYRLINFKYLETEQVDDNLNYLIRGTYDYMKKCQKFFSEKD